MLWMWVSTSQRTLHLLFDDTVDYVYEYKSFLFWETCESHNTNWTKGKTFFLKRCVFKAKLVLFWSHVSVCFNVCNQDAVVIRSCWFKQFSISNLDECYLGASIWPNWIHINLGNPSCNLLLEDNSVSLLIVGTSFLGCRVIIKFCPSSAKRNEMISCKNVMVIALPCDLTPRRPYFRILEEYK
jgi:hypothetical protein